MNIRAIAQAVKSSLCIGLTALLFCAGLVFSNVQPAVAGNKAANVVQNRAEQELDRVAGAGTADQIKGRAEADLGRVQREVGQATDDVGSRAKGVAKQVEGRATKDIGRTQSAAENAADQIEDTSEGFIDSVKDLFD